MDRAISRKNRGILNDLDATSRQAIYDAGIVETRQKGELIYDEKQDISFVDFVLAGFVSLYRNSRYGEKRTIFICTKDEMLNEVILEKERTSFAAKALSEVTLLRVPAGKFREILKNDFSLVEAVYSSISSKTRRLFHQMGNANGTYPLEKHLASKLWKLARDYGEDTEKGREIPFEVTVTLLASMLGAKRETVSRAMSKFKKEGYILHENGVLTVPDLEGIRTLM